MRQEGREGHSTTALLLPEVQVEHIGQQHLINSTSSRLGRNPGSVVSHASCGCRLFGGGVECSSSPGRSYQIVRDLPDTNKMDAESCQSEWSRVISFDFFCPAIDCWAYDTLHLVAASFTPMV